MRAQQAAPPHRRTAMFANEGAIGDSINSAARAKVFGAAAKARMSVHFGVHHSIENAKEYSLRD